MTTKPKVLSVFSGCGGLDLGFDLEGYKTVWANDYSEWAVASFRNYFGDVIHLGDITQINPYTDKVGGAGEASNESRAKHPDSREME